MKPAHTYYSASVRNLRSLLIIRSLIILCQSGLLWYFLDQEIATAARTGMLFSLCTLLVITILSFLRSYLKWPVTDIEYAAQLSIDVLGLSALLYFSGGANNPFVSYYLVPLVICAALLPRGYTWFIAVLSLSAYSLLMYFYVPLPLLTPPQHAHGTGMNIHVVGMWVNFFVSVCLITYFVVGMGAALRRQERESKEKREDVFRYEQIHALAGLATGTAHELGPPLATISVLLEEMQATETNPARLDDHQLLSEQIQLCKLILDKLSRTAQLKDVGETHRVDLVAYMNSIVQQWLVMRPDVTVQVSACSREDTPELDVELSLGQALENLLNNAANAWPKGIEVDLDWNDTEMSISITDQGPGIPVHMMDKIGKPILRDNGHGVGLGLLLSHATINRYGGDIKLQNLPEGGTRATLRLPRTQP
jgi:two-component system sensor histidine kinase RegB